MRILLIDDHDATREVVASLLDHEQDLQVAGQATDGEQGMRLAGQLAPDLVLMDLVMPHMNGIEATRRLLAEHPGTRVLVLSNHAERPLVAAALEAGAAGFVRKDRAYEELIPAIRAVAGGRQYVDRELLA